MHKTKIKVLKAFHGDCIIIYTLDNNGNEYNILIDGGTAKTFDYSLKKELKGLSTIHLLILTHIDSDHIAGLLRFIKNSLFSKIEIEKFWINSPNFIDAEQDSQISYGQAKKLDKLLIEKGVDNSLIESNITTDFKPSLPVDVEILSPTPKILDLLHKEWPKINQQPQQVKIQISSQKNNPTHQTSLQNLAKEIFKPNKSTHQDIFNSSSIALYLNLNDLKILLLGDARSEIILESLKEKGYSKKQKLKADYVKISHHGSKNNTSCDLLDLIDCDHFIISTNGGNAHHKHPDREVIARIIHHSERNYNKKRTIYFNYPFSDIQGRCGHFLNSKDEDDGNWQYKDDVNVIP